VFDNTTALTLCLIGAFLLGSVPPGLFIARARGVDIRKVGSGNIGTTNVLRSVGKTEAVLTLVLDIAKGLLPVVAIGPVFRWLELPIPSLEVFAPYTADTLLVAQGLVGLAAILGHNFSIFLAFKGGKGVASSIGVVFGLSPHVGLILVTIWLFTFSRTKTSSLGALASFGALPAVMYFYDKSVEKTVIAGIITVLLYIRHIPNIKRILEGTEGKFVRK
jgi:glycerol-3-phosphate acyltransferase PlsY